MEKIVFLQYNLTLWPSKKTLSVAWSIAHIFLYFDDKNHTHIVQMVHYPEKCVCVWMCLSRGILPQMHVTFDVWTCFKCVFMWRFVRERNDFIHGSHLSGKCIGCVCMSVCGIVLLYINVSMSRLTCSSSSTSSGDVLCISPVVSRSVSPLSLRGGGRGGCFIVHHDSIKTHNDDSLSWFPLSLWCSLNAPTTLWVFSSPRQTGRAGKAAELQIA